MSITKLIRSPMAAKVIGSIPITPNEFNRVVGFEPDPTFTILGPGVCTITNRWNFQIGDSVHDQFSVYLIEGALALHVACPPDADPATFKSLLRASGLEQLFRTFSQTR